MVAPGASVMAPELLSNHASAGTSMVISTEEVLAGTTTSPEAV
jgi:hypothetical protein